ncbi:hypothetical protein B5E80_06950 [Flavonifractor sp. An135]|nr:carbohydrate-binding domain-containing protein [Flavonifractor sp. An135]OUQ24536.1 hypothetical protein B5E80_06950 [Flavonifractor sp. An135]
MNLNLLPLALSALCLLSACQAAPSSESAQPSASDATVTVSAAAQTDTTLFSERDLAGTYDADSAIAIQLTGGSASCDSSAVAIDGDTVTITAEGVYLLSGTLTDGQIRVAAEDTAKVQLVLDGADITSPTSAAIYAYSADKVFVTLAEGSENTLTNGGSYVAIDENNIDAVLFAKTDLTLNGTGSLTINAQDGHGVVSKDDLVIVDGTYTVTAASTGFTGKDSLSIAGGTFTVTSGKDALHAENTDDATLGSLYIADGAFTLDAQGDGISASGTLQIDGGTFSVVTGGGSSTVTLTSSESFGAGRPGETQTQTSSASTEETDTASTKGLKADGSLTLNGGTFTLDTADDSLHAGGDILITSGEFNLSSGDDAIHSDAAVTIRGGTFTIPYCYEGIEGLSITIDDGTFDITSYYDDGVNAAGGADGSGFGPRQDTFSSTSSSTSSITINGGTFTIVSTGDCLDSNGDLTINGGTLDLTCNGSGNTTLDTDGTFTNNGGDLTTNDGSESNPGGMAGGHGGGMMGGGRGGQAAPSGMSNAGSGSAEIPSA